MTAKKFQRQYSYLDPIQLIKSIQSRFVTGCNAITIPKILFGLLYFVRKLISKMVFDKANLTIYYTQIILTLLSNPAGQFRHVLTLRGSFFTFYPAV